MTLNDTLSEVYISDISDSDMDHFKTIVINDIKSTISEDQKNYLLSNLTLWNYHLQILRRDIELQLSCQKTKVKVQQKALDAASEEEIDGIKQFLSEQEKWRMGALKFLSNIERRSLYVKILISQTYDYAAS